MENFKHQTNKQVSDNHTRLDKKEIQQKEQLKNLCADVDLLTMTATPTPRTLNLAMAGLRDLSVIATPPAKRQVPRLLAWAALARHTATMRRAHVGPAQRPAVSRVAEPARPRTALGDGAGACCCWTRTTAS